MSMRGRVKLGFDGNFYQGFEIELELGQEGQLPDVVCKGYLPANVELVSRLHQWRQTYRGLSCTSNRIQPGQIVYGGGSIQQYQACQEYAQALSADFQQWLQAESFREICDRIREKLDPDDEIRVLLSTDNPELRQLPWQQWNLLDRYSHTEVALSPSVYERQFIRNQSSDHEEVRILAVLGNSTGINVEADRHFLQNLPDADITFLDEPKPEELQESLYKQSWDILFFAGHGYTAEDQGYIHLNPTDQLSIKELKHALKAAISKGLELAIFNSCDGLGLATDLELLNLPQLVVMREPVPDKVAQQFLKHFLQAYSAGYPLHLAVRDAREKLHILEKEYPCASWLPTLFQHPTAEPPTWNSFRGRTGGRIAGSQWNRLQQVSARASLRPRLNRRSMLAVATIVAILSTTFVQVISPLPIFQVAELKVYDQLMRMRPAEPPDDRFLIVTIDEADKQYQDFHGMERQGSLSDEAILKILDLTKDHPPRVIATNIYHNFSYHPELADRLETGNNFITVCQGPVDNDVVGSEPPPIPEDSNISVGFADLIEDLDHVVRRQIIRMGSIGSCDVKGSFSEQIAKKYLQGENLIGNFEDQLDQAVSVKLNHQSGGYSVDPLVMAEHQILINYRLSKPHQTSLTRILDGSLIKQNPELIEDKILLIGLAKNPSKAIATPYAKEGVPNIEIHYQMASQIISAIHNQRDLFSAVSSPRKRFWLSAWGFVGAIFAINISSRNQLAQLILLNLILISFSCYLFMLNGIWFPFLSTALSFVITVNLIKFIINIRGQSK